uniref:Uncharacterized protein n=1 Tax=Pithovirus LCPAC403 TaxID=2506596 RepID=A0A481ZBG9_9VIRU|nr:MAG: hypothetical protein LCPAC403_03920 [Pithovirus LCPAC403]
MEAELLEHSCILANFSFEFNINDDKDSTCMTQFIIWIAEKDDEKLNKFKAIVYLNAHYDYVGRLHEEMKEVLYTGLRKKLGWCLENEKISRETYEYYDNTIPIMDE